VGGWGGTCLMMTAGFCGGGRGLGGRLTVGVASKYPMPRPLGDLCIGGSMALLID